MTESVENILPRVLNEEQQKVLNELSDILEEVVNFGTHLIKWDLDQKTGSDERLTCILFLRNLIEEIDSISILTRKSAIDSAKSLLRTALENFFYLEYIFQEDTYNRSMSFLVWDTINQQTLINKFDLNKEQGKEFKSKLEKDKLLNDFDFTDEKTLEKYREFGKNLLEHEEYKKVTAEYYRTKNSTKSKKNPQWYSLFDGPKNLELLAVSIGYPAIYDAFYRNYSMSTHGNDIIRGKIKITENGKPGIVQIRYPGDLHLVVFNSINIAIMAYIAYCKARLPEKVESFQEWYKSISPTIKKTIKLKLEIK